MSKRVIGAIALVCALAFLAVAAFGQGQPTTPKPVPPLDEVPSSTLGEEEELRPQEGADEAIPDWVLTILGIPAQVTIGIVTLLEGALGSPDNGPLAAFREWVSATFYTFGTLFYVASLILLLIKWWISRSARPKAKPKAKTRTKVPRKRSRM